MDNAVVARTNANALPLVEPAGFGARVAAVPLKAKLSFALGIAALGAVVLAMTMWSSQGDYKVLYANLSDKDGGAIIAQLSQMNVPYRHADGGAAILVPAAKVHDVRLKLARLAAYKPAPWPTPHAALEQLVNLRHTQDVARGVER